MNPPPQKNTKKKKRNGRSGAPRKAQDPTEVNKSDIHPPYKYKFTKLLKLTTINYAIDWTKPHIF